MPAVNPRIAVYLPRSVAATVTRLAGLRGVSRSAVIREFLIEAEPVFQRVANMLELAARTDRTALKEWALTLDAAQSHMEQQATEALATMDRAIAGAERLPRAKPKRGGGRGRRTQGAARPRRTPGQ